ncbi:hypothetical protein D3C78_1808470 [compost metagenome]
MFALTQQFAGIFQQRAAIFGQLRLPAAAALEQRDAQVCFQQGDGITDGRLGLALFAGNGRKGAQFGDAQKNSQLLQVPLLSHQPIPISDR